MAELTSREQLEKMDDPFLVMTATGIVRELSGDAIAYRYKNAPPPRRQLIRFILENQP
jgi:hypothetical protein